MSPDLPPLPEGFAETRRALHTLAERVVKVAREEATGEFSMVRTPGGFGTPPFGDGNQIRIEGAELVVAEGGEERRAPITTLAEAGRFAGPRLLPGAEGLPDQPLPVDAAAAEALAAAFAVGQEALERLVAEAAEGDDPTPPTLWPEHFDLAIEMGRDSRGARANYGMSPGDEDHDEPYFYAGPWSAEVTGDLWNARGFSGAEVGYSELAQADDPVHLIVGFALERKRDLERLGGAG